MFRLPRSLGPQIAPTGADLRPRGSRAVYTTQPPGWLPAPGRGIASRPRRATGAAGLSPAELQPCRLLTITFLLSDQPLLVASISIFLLTETIPQRGYSHP